MRCLRLPTSARIRKQQAALVSTIQGKLVAAVRMEATHTSAASKTTSQANGAASKPAKKAPSQGDLVTAALIRSPAPLVDIGINLVHESFHKDTSDIIERARAANVGCMIVTGTCVKSAHRAQKLCQHTQNYPLYFTAGVHPHDAKTCTATTIQELRQIAKDPRCVAIGECGLDFNRNFSPPDVQEVWFDKQVALAVELRKPLFMHCRDAGPKFAEILGRYAPLPAPAVIHCFTGTKEELESFLALGLHIGITGWVCDDRPERGGAELASLLPTIPKDRLMIETDAPFLVPRTIKPSKSRPNRNEPALLPHVLQTVAAALNETPEEVAIRTTDTARRVFGVQF